MGKNYRLKDVHEFAKLYNKLSTNDNWEEEQPTSSLTNGRSTIIFHGDKKKITLNSDFDGNTYDVVVEDEE